MKRHEFKSGTLVLTGRFLTLYDADGTRKTRRIYRTEERADAEFERHVILLESMGY